MKIVIYSAVFGGYDDPQPYLVSSFLRENVEFVWISDEKLKNGNCWETWYHPYYQTDDKYKYAKTNRFFKLQPHKTDLIKSDINIYIDSNKRLFNIDMLLGYCQELWDNPNLDAIFCRHTERDTVAQEVREVARLRRDDPKLVMNQYKKYIKEGFPDDIPLIVASVQIRKTKAPDLQDMLDCWWNEVYNKSYRDQISMPYAIWKTDFRRYRTINVWTERLKMIANSNHKKVLHV